MSKSLTDERLRHYLNSNQGARERLIADLLPQLGPYNNCRPQRPDGGPDGGADIYAELMDTRSSVRVAIGFKNNAGPANVDRKWAIKKFDSDLSTASEKSQKVKNFIFVTNVDLTPSTIRTLKERAHDHNFDFIEIYDREKLRLALDNPKGFFIRLRYLDIPMTTEDQYNLLTTMGDKLGDLANQVTTIESKVNESSLQHSLDSSIRSMAWSVNLDKLSKDKAGKHAILFVFPSLPEAPVNLALIHEFTIDKNLDGSSSTVWLWHESMKEEVSVYRGSMSILSTGDSSELQPTNLRLSILFDWHQPTRPTLYRILRAGFRLYATPGIFNNIKKMSILFNNLKVLDSALPDENVHPATAQPEWTKNTPQKFTTEKWEALAASVLSEIHWAVHPLI